METIQIEYRQHYEFLLSIIYLRFDETKKEKKIYINVELILKYLRSTEV